MARSTTTARRIAPLGLLALLGAGAAALAQGPGPRVIERDGQRVEVRVTTHGEGSTAVCLESADGVRGKKWVTVHHGGVSTRLSTARGDHGPHCAFFEPAGDGFRVRLEHNRFVVVSSLLADLEYEREEARGKTLTFRWVRE